jgi:hypothetical protein
VAEFPKQPDKVLDLCEALDRPGPPPGRFRDGERDAGATARISEAATLSAQLMSQYANVPAYAAAHARYVNHLGMGLYRTGKLRDAEAEYRKALRIQGRLVRQYPDSVVFACWLSLMEYGLARVHADRSEWKDARAGLGSAAERLEMLRKKNPSLGFTRPLLTNIYRELEYVLDSSGETAPAAEVARKADQLRADEGPRASRPSAGPHGP